MSREDIPDALQSFLSRYVSSVEQLEILCLLISKPDDYWTAASVYKVVQSTVASVEQGLEKLTAFGFLARTSTAPSTYELTMDGETRTMLTNLCAFYREKPVRIIEAIYKKPTISSVQSFADAFKFKNPKLP